MDRKFYEVSALKQSIPISLFLADLGFLPVKKSGGEAFYHSMIRDGDKTPSFCVNDRMGFWFDHGLGKGGDLIDLARSFWPALTFIETLEKIVEQHEGIISADNRLVKPVESVIKEREPWYKIHRITEIGHTKSLSSYLDFRGIKEIAKHHLKEIHYEVTLHNKAQKTFIAAGLPNVKGGWEIRNSSFKGSLGKKGISMLPASNSSLKIFEGFMDFLSWKKDNPGSDTTIAVLNSVININAVLPLAAGFSSVDAFFDNDQAGRKAMDMLIQSVPHAKNCSACYEGYKDYNEKQMAENPRPWKDRSEIAITGLYKPLTGKR